MNTCEIVELLPCVPRPLSRDGTLAFAPLMLAACNRVRRRRLILNMS